MFYKSISDGFIVAIGRGESDNPITEQEFLALKAMIANKPTDPEGFVYKLRADTLEWELVELPPAPEPEPSEDEEATEMDYQNALEQMGVMINE